MEWVPPKFEEIKMDAEAKSYCDDFATRDERVEPRDAEPRADAARTEI